MAKDKKQQESDHKFNNNIIPSNYPEPRNFKPEEIKELRRKLAGAVGLEGSITPTDLARLVGATRGAVYSWERDDGNRNMSGTSRRLLQILDLVPCAAGLLISENGWWKMLLQRDANNSAQKSEPTDENDGIG